MPDTLLSPEVVPLDSLRRHPRNYRGHPPDQLDHIRASLQAHGQYRNVVIARDGTILAGHGVCAAAEREGWATVSVIRLPLDPDDPRAIKVLVGDNEIAGRAEPDPLALADLLRHLADVDDLLGTGYDERMLADLILDTAPPDVIYTDKVESPIYEPSGPPPAVEQLTDGTTRDALLGEIEAADLPPDVAWFLRVAAHRHTRFDYAAIANYYAHAPADVRRLMEASALVIIDYDQAVERGFVRLHEETSDAFHDDFPDA